MLGTQKLLGGFKWNLHTLLRGVCRAYTPIFKQFYILMKTLEIWTLSVIDVFFGLVRT